MKTTKWVGSLLLFLLLLLALGGGVDASPMLLGVPPQGVEPAIMNNGPYISALTPYSAIITWQTNQPATVNQVEYGVTPDYGLVAPAYQTEIAEEDSGTFYIHSAQLTNLTPDTEYYYKVSSDGVTSDHGGPGWRFRTFPPEGTPSFRFIVYGDSRYAGDYANNPLWHEKVLRGILNDDPPLLINLGDIVARSDHLLEWADHDYEGWLRCGWDCVGTSPPIGDFFRIVGSERIAGPERLPLMQRVWIPIVKGNHEVMGNYPDLFAKVFEHPYAGNGGGTNASEDYFAFTYANARMIFLRHSGSEGIYEGDEQYNWLVRELQAAAASGKWIFVFLHQPVFVVDSNANKYADGYMFRAQEYLVPLFQQYGVDLVFSGHHHVYTRHRNALYYKGRDSTPPVIEERSEGVRYITQGTACKGIHGIRLTDGKVMTWVYDDSGPRTDWSGSRRMALYELDVYAAGGGYNKETLPAYTIVEIEGDQATITTKGMYNAGWSTDSGTTEGVVIDTDTFRKTGTTPHTPQQFYVSPTGSDANPGTPEAPWRTLQHAADHVAPGDTVIVAGGEYAPFCITRGGTPAARITFRAPGRDAVINGSISCGGKSRTAGIFIYDVGYVTVEGFDVRPTGTGYREVGIQAGYAESTVENPREVRGIVVRHNRVTGAGWVGISASYSRGVIIEYNEVSGSVRQHGIYVANSADGPIIRGNIVHSNNHAGIQINADPENAASWGGDGIIYHALVEGNIVYNNGLGGSAGLNFASIRESIIRNNLLFNNHASGIASWDDSPSYAPDPPAPDGYGSKYNQYLNNTVIQPAGSRSAFSLANGSTHNIVKNNVFVHLGNKAAFSIDQLSAELTSYEGLESDYNVFYSGSGRPIQFTEDNFITLDAWQAQTGQDQHSFSVSDVDALFMDRAADDYRPLPAGPTVDAGTPPGNVTRDIEGTLRPQGVAFDIGAYEYLPCELPGDVVRDGRVDLADLQAVAADWRNPAFDPLHDLDADHDVDVVDIMEVAKWWGERCDGSPAG